MKSHHSEQFEIKDNNNIVFFKNNFMSIDTSTDSWLNDNYEEMDNFFVKDHYFFEDSCNNFLIAHFIMESFKKFSFFA